MSSNPNCCIYSSHCMRIVKHKHGTVHSANHKHNEHKVNLIENENFMIYAPLASLL